MEKIAVYDNHAGEYDQWFDKHPAWFQSELKALVLAHRYGFQRVFNNFCNSRI